MTYSTKISASSTERRSVKAGQHQTNTNVQLSLNSPATVAFLVISLVAIIVVILLYPPAVPAFLAMSLVVIIIVILVYPPATSGFLAIMKDAPEILKALTNFILALRNQQSAAPALPPAATLPTLGHN